MTELPYDKCLFLITPNDDGGIVEGRILKEKVLFASPDELIFRLQQMMDFQRFPQQTSTLRRFIARRGGKKIRLSFEMHEPEVDTTVQQFWLVIRSRSHSEWQGMLQMPGNTVEKFSSIVELAHLLHQAGYFEKEKISVVAEDSI